MFLAFHHFLTHFGASPTSGPQQDHKKKATLNGLDALPALQNGTGNGAAASAGGAEGAATEGAEAGGMSTLGMWINTY
jgi:hypothetical protein